MHHYIMQLVFAGDEGRRVHAVALFEAHLVYIGEMLGGLWLTFEVLAFFFAVVDVDGHVFEEFHYLDFFLLMITCLELKISQRKRFLIDLKVDPIVFHKLFALRECHVQPDIKIFLPDHPHVQNIAQKGPFLPPISSNEFENLSFFILDRYLPIIVTLWWHVVEIWHMYGEFGVWGGGSEGDFAGWSHRS